MKRGVLFSLIIVIVAITLISILLIQRELISFEREKISIKQELIDMDNSYGSIERSIHILSEVASRRALIYSLNILIEEGQFFESNQTPQILSNLVWNGTYQGKNVPFLENNSLEKNIASLETFYANSPRNYKIDILINPEDISISLSDSFHLVFSTSAQINLSNPRVANISRIINVSEKVSLEGFEDPLYLINITQGKGSRIIIKNPISNSFPWDNSTFITHVEEGFYLSSSEGPSLFDRFEGKTYCDYCKDGSLGLETFIDKNNLIGQGIDIDIESSNLDYKYLESISGYSYGYNETSTESASFKYFRMDADTYQKYLE